MTRTTRLAPSPTGALHLGNARTFLINWLMARQNGWKVLLRIEDIDGPRIKRNAAQQVLSDLQFLGIDWDAAPIYQTHRLHLYHAAMDQLLASGKVYPCVCTRKEIELSASAPHAEDGSTIYPGTCRGRFTNVQDAMDKTGRPPALRFAMPDRTLTYTDLFTGQQTYNPSRQLGDFIIAKPDRTPAYQLAVVVDDADSNVTDIVRGDDLIDSTPRQMLLYDALGLSHKIPAYTHLPLVIGQDGKRLAKRHGDTRIEHYRGLGTSSGRLRALIARWLGIQSEADTMSMDNLLNQFDVKNIPHHPIVFAPEDDAFLRQP